VSRIAVIGAGYVGLTTAVCLSHLGHTVCCADILADRVALLEDGHVPLVEEGLAGLLQQGLAARRLQFSSDNVQAVTQAEFTFLCVPTPQQQDGRADLQYIERVASEIGQHLAAESVVINKSTVPVGSARVVERALARPDVAVVSNPEFLREGSAVHDFLHPDRIVIGADDEATAIKVAALFVRIGAPLLVTGPATAEMIKYASNAFLATKVSFANAIATLCESVGADVRQVVLGMGYDHRIGSEYLRPGPGWGGSCFPKDTAALVHIAEDAGYDFGLLKGVIAVNDDQAERTIAKAIRLAGGSIEGKTVALWGLTFKARTDDLRGSPAVAIARRLGSQGARVLAYDPTVRQPLDGMEVCADPYEACVGASVLIVATEWDELRWLDFTKVGDLMEARAVLDARNLLEPAMLRRLGFVYQGVGVA
jgi:UDPglucose 6-dehydrogenase